MTLENTAAHRPFQLPAWLKKPSTLTWAIVGLAFILRVLWLGIKPPHFDEGVNGWFVNDMLQKGYYHYDPTNYHGPFHFYVLFVVNSLFGPSVAAFRFPLILINTVTVWLILQFQRYLPRPACLLAALVMAVSPGMLFYTRYAIHEAWLVFGMLLALWGAAELWVRGRERGLWCVMAGVTLMILTKETYIIHFVSFGLAVLSLLVLERFIPSAPAQQRTVGTWPQSQIVKAVGVSVFLILFFYSGTFLDPSSLAGLASSFQEWIHTGTKGGGHEKEWYYWLKLSAVYEWPVLIGMLYSLRVFLPGMNRVARLIAIYGLGTLVAYSIVNYKTPWCVISVIWPFMVLFGCGVIELFDLLKKRALNASTNQSKIIKAAVGISCAAVLAGSLGIAIRLNYFRYVDPDEPYVYVQSGKDLFKVTDNLKSLVAKNPEAYSMPIYILLSDYHPLPWLLANYTATGYYSSPKTKIANYNAGLLIVPDDRISEVEKRLSEEYFVEPFKFRADLTAGRLYLNKSWFAPIYPNRPADFVPQSIE